MGGQHEEAIHNFSASDASGSAVTFDGRDAGEMRSGLDGVGLALLRIDAVDNANGAALDCGDARLSPVKPAWASY